MQLFVSTRFYRERRLIGGITDTKIKFYKESILKLISYVKEDLFEYQDFIRLFEGFNQPVS